MKRLLFTVVAWGVVLLPMAAQAQRGMGFHGSSAPVARPAPAARPAGFVGRPMPMGHVAPAGIRATPAGRVMTPQGRRVVIPGQRGLVSRPAFRFHTFHNNHFHHNHAFFGTCFNTFGGGFPCGNPFFSSGLYAPYYDPFYTSSYSSQPEPQPVVEEQDNGNRELALQVQELSEEIQAMRSEDRAREERKESSAKPARQDDGPNATLVFRDGLQLSVKNYAVSGDTIWVLDDHTTRKVPLAKLDVAATQKINEQNGVEFRLPKNN